MFESIIVDVFMLLYYRICFWFSYICSYVYFQEYIQLIFMNIFYMERDKIWKKIVYNRINYI